ncbi:hypothetical protein KKH82_07515 [Patescibacteria group bacterium]|nr:hypothetical protein [Patescibacteria group bacterium]MBU1627252.1 hypothetical protein [bacterium]
MKTDSRLRSFQYKNTRKKILDKTLLFTRMKKETIQYLNKDLFTVLSTIQDPTSYTQDLINEKQRQRLPTLKAFKQFLKEKNINNAVQFYTYGKEELKSQFGCQNLSILLKKAVHDRLEEPERYQLCSMLGWDLVEDTKKELADK